MAATGNEVVLLKQLKDYGDTKLNAPASEGTDGQVLVYGSSGNLWVTVPEFITETEADEAYAAKSHTHAVATASVAGFMSAADKTKLDGLSNYTLPTASDDDFDAYMGIA